MKLTNCRVLGRYVRPDGAAVNVHKGTVVGRGTDVLFFLCKNKRQFISEGEFRSAWKVAMPSGRNC